MKTCCQPLYPHRRDNPVAIASGSFEKIEMPLGTIQKCSTQFIQKSCIIACSGEKVRIERATFISHRQKS